MKGRELSDLLRAAMKAAEDAHLGDLVAAYQRTLNDAASRASDKFALTAAADWQPPAEGATLTVAQIAALATALNTRLTPIWTRILLEVPEPVFARIEIAWDVKHPLAQALLNQAGKRTGARLGEASQFILRDTLGKAYDQGLDVRATSALIQSAMSEAAPWQADMLARTDLNSLGNGSSKAAAQATGMAYMTWLAVLDDKTRPEHAEADGQTVGINDVFVVGGEECSYPCDPVLSDAMSASCRCSLYYGETLDEAGGLTADASIIPAVATKTQRKRKHERRAANGKPALVAAAALPSGMDAMPTGVKSCAMNGTPGYSGGGACHMHDGTEAGMKSAMRKAQADASKKNANSLLASARPIAFEGTAAIEGKLSDDNSIAPRVLLPDSLSWPEMPVSFMAQTVTAEGHDGAEVAGRIDSFARKRSTGKMRNITFAGEFTTQFGIEEIAPMIDDETMRYVSADLGASEWALVDRATLSEVPDSEFDLAKAQDGAYALGLMSGKIKAVTLVPTQAIEGAMIALTASADRDGICIFDASPEGDVSIIFPLENFSIGGEALVAAAAPLNPPRSWFETPEPPGKMPLTVLEDGRVYGHLAPWDSCHVSFLPSCIPPPRSPTNYARFHVAELDTDDGPLMVGKLMFSAEAGHADRRLSGAKASTFYDRTGTEAAYLRAIDGQYGVWVCGALNPRLTDGHRKELRRELRLNPPSGDWRPFSEGYDLICGLAVPIPGFPVARTTVTIVASGEGVEVEDAIIASAGWFEPDPAALAALEHLGLLDEEMLADRRMNALAARAEGLDALAALID